MGAMSDSGTRSFSTVARGPALLTALCLLALPACGARPQAPERARVRFVLQPPNARVYVEDRFVGAGRLLRVRPRSFPTGPRHFTITADGYFPHDVAVDLPAGTTTIRLRLRPIPP